MIRTLTPAANVIPPFAALALRSLAAITLTLTVLPAPAPAAPVTTHPRLWLTAADLPKLRLWAVPSNPVWQGFSSALSQAISNYDARLFPGGNPAVPFPGNGVN